ncbi:hypothetical protein EDC56_1686 [Sinobacterium caligoides]|uniref:Uncharacterized protein n=1 Tax=Sinobacterium caligoides TaxID=933926 RepID=A0A3N2DN67_9GAMM|nr:hypothetical protein EDC56_1686 [Sinobacterium caligoides]
MIVSEVFDHQQLAINTYQYTHYIKAIYEIRARESCLACDINRYGD